MLHPHSALLCNQCRDNNQNSIIRYTKIYNFAKYMQCFILTLLFSAINVMIRIALLDISKYTILLKSNVTQANKLSCHYTYQFVAYQQHQVNYYNMAIVTRNSQVTWLMLLSISLLFRFLNFHNSSFSSLLAVLMLQYQLYVWAEKTCSALNETNGAP